MRFRRYHYRGGTRERRGQGGIFNQDNLICRGLRRGFLFVAIDRMLGAAGRHIAL